MSSQENSALMKTGMIDICASFWGWVLKILLVIWQEECTEFMLHYNLPILP